MRLSPEQDSAPLIAAATRYLEKGVQYDFADLVFFAGLLIYRAVRPTQRWQKITDIILNAACAQLDKFLNRLIHKGKNVPGMVCSQLVYQCYFDCGENYKIVLKDALLQDCLSEEVCLADLVEDLDGNTFMTSTMPVKNIDLEMTARELYFALEEDELAVGAATLDTNELQNVIGSAKRFLDLVEQILEHSDIDIPVPALFVAPSDLLNHAVNLKQYGVTMISRD